jgi:hypothetical protein
LKTDFGAACGSIAPGQKPSGVVIR